MSSLNINDLQVDSFIIDGGDTVPFTTPEGIDMEGMQPLFAPITAHTDPCDVCCQQQ